LAEAAGAVLFFESAPTLLLSVPSDDVGGTGENPWESFIRHYPQPTTNIPPPHYESQVIATCTRDQAIEDLVEIDRDDDDDSNMINTQCGSALANADERGILFMFP
jgi:hypothetical protein